MTHVDIDTALGMALAVMPSQRALDHMDARVAAASAAEGRTRWGTPFRRPLAAITIGLVVVLTAGAGGVTLLDRMFRGASAGEELAWERATRLDLQDTRRGVTVGLERAYMDGARIVMGLTSEGYNYADARLWVDGRRAEGGVVSGHPTKRGSAHVLLFRTPAGIGDRAELVLEVRSLWRNIAPDGPVPRASAHDRVGEGPERAVIEGPWRFAFGLRSQGAATVWAGSVSATASGVTMTLDRLRVSPTLIEGSLTWTGDPLSASRDDVWTAHGRLRHGGERLGLDGGSTSGHRFEFRIERGTDDPSGAWTLRIDALTSDPGSPPRQVRIGGPWVFPVSLPD